MSQRREIEARLALYDELSGILGAMRSFALAELRKIGKRETTQQLLVQNLSAALNSVAFALSPPKSRNTISGCCSVRYAGFAPVSTRTYCVSGKNKRMSLRLRF